MTETPNRITVTRRLDASPERVFDAWTQPETARKWLFTSPESESNTTELDVRVGGRWTITDRRGGVNYMGLGDYLEVDRPRRLVFTFGMPQFSPDFDKIIVEIEADGDGSILTLTQEGLPAGYEDDTISGWGKMLDVLKGVLGDAVADRTGT